MNHDLIQLLNILLRKEAAEMNEFEEKDYKDMTRDDVVDAEFVEK